MRIALALSGGIDSSAAAWLLKKQGCEVVAFTMRHYDNSPLGFAKGEGIDAVISQAQKVCRFLEIEHRIINLQDDFSQSVMNYFVSDYMSARTPNPCTVCNRLIKWGSFLQAVKAQGIDKMATGHYIRLLQKDGIYHLYKAADRNKDQSYMLWQLDQKQLDSTIFPLADFTKSQARKIIKENSIPVSIDKESQEICFIKDHYEEFLKCRMPFVPGDIITTAGEIIGTHMGLPLYTIGQRKRLHTAKNSPLFVKELDAINNRLIVTANPAELNRTEFEINQINWIASLPEIDHDLMVKIRYNSPAQEVQKFIQHGTNLQVLLKNPVRAITPGQSAVFYHDDELLGGGVII
jgi:tRNA-uridine 2-sulfurtransferase